MKRTNVVQNIIQFLFKYIWIICALLIVMEFFSTIYTTNILMKQSTANVLQATSSELSNRVDNILNLLNGFANDERITDETIEQYKRANLTSPYNESYDLFMIALTDEKFIVDSNELTAPSDFSLAGRDYLQELYKTGNYQITDAFLAGSDGKTLNYTIAVPIIKNEKVVGSIFGSIYFDEIAKMLSRDDASGRTFHLLGQNNTFMTDKKSPNFQKSYEHYISEDRLIGIKESTILKKLNAGKSCSYWKYGDKGFTYVMLEKVNPTNWTLVYEVPVSTMMGQILPALIIKTIFYIIICATIAFLGRRYLNRNLATVNHLMDRMGAMQRALFQDKEEDNYEEFLELTSKGLHDQLTGLSTRAVLFNNAEDILKDGKDHVVLFIDLDNMKMINDNYTHEAGDLTLIKVGEVLKRVAKEHHGIASRYGGDEFIVILSDLDEAKVDTFADDLCRELSMEIEFHGQTFSIFCSIGVSLFPSHGTQLEELINKADLALYIAKQEGKHHCVMHHE